jgi:ABC-2 type transport system permease protein
MDAAHAAAFAPRRWLPYWAVFQTDLRQTLRSWVYLIWIAVSVLACTGYLLYRFGLQNEVGMIQKASSHANDLIRWLVLGSLSLVVVLTVSSISSERGALADSVLSRGISRFQYFLAKWHARLFIVLATFGVLFGLVCILSNLLFEDDMTFSGAISAALFVSAVLTAIVSCGVTIGAITSSTILGISIFWIFLYGAGFLMAALPDHYPSPIRTMAGLPKVLVGDGSLYALQDLFIVSVLVSLLAAGFGMAVFSREDV